MIVDLIIEGTNKTPSVKFQAEEGILEISGRSIPENSIEFYQPMFNWIDLYASNPLAKTNAKIILEYFNTSSSKCILDVLRKLEQINKSGKSEIVVLWHDGSTAWRSFCAFGHDRPPKCGGSYGLICAILGADGHYALEHFYDIHVRVAVYYFWRYRAYFWTNVAVWLHHKTRPNEHWQLGFNGVDRRYYRFYCQYLDTKHNALLGH